MALSGTGVGDSSNQSGWVAPISLPASVYPFTIACWFRVPSSGVDNSTFFALGNSATATCLSLFYFFSGLYSDIKDDAGGTAEPNGSWTPDGKWHHLAIRLEQDSVQQLYLDGVAFGSSQAAVATTFTFDRLQIGFAPAQMSDPAFAVGSAAAEFVVFESGIRAESDIARLAEGANPRRVAFGSRLAAYYPLRGDLHGYSGSGRRVGLSAFGAPGDPVWTDHPPVDRGPAGARVFLLKTPAQVFSESLSIAGAAGASSAGTFTATQQSAVAGTSGVASSGTGTSRAESSIPGTAGAATGSAASAGAFSPIAGSAGQTSAGTAHATGSAAISGSGAVSGAATYVLRGTVSVSGSGQVVASGQGSAADSGGIAAAAGTATDYTLDSKGTATVAGAAAAQSSGSASADDAASVVGAAGQASVGLAQARDIVPIGATASIDAGTERRLSESVTQSASATFSDQASSSSGESLPMPVSAGGAATSSMAGRGAGTVAAQAGAGTDGQAAAVDQQEILASAAADASGGATVSPGVAVDASAGQTASAGQSASGAVTASGSARLFDPSRAEVSDDASVTASTGASTDAEAFTLDTIFLDGGPSQEVSGSLSSVRSASLAGNAWAAVGGGNTLAEAAGIQTGAGTEAGFATVEHGTSAVAGAADTIPLAASSGSDKASVQGDARQAASGKAESDDRVALPVDNALDASGAADVPVGISLPASASGTATFTRSGSADVPIAGSAETGTSVGESSVSESIAYVATAGYSAVVTARFDDGIECAAVLEFDLDGQAIVPGAITVSAAAQTDADGARYVTGTIGISGLAGTGVAGSAQARQEVSFTGALAASAAAVSTEAEAAAIFGFAAAAISDKRSAIVVHVLSSQRSLYLSTAAQKPGANQSLGGRSFVITLRGQRSESNPSSGGRSLVIDLSGSLSN